MIHGTADELLAAINGDLVASLIPGARLELLERRRASVLLGAAAALGRARAAVRAGVPGTVQRMTEIAVRELGRTIAYSFEDMLKYHGPGSPGGVAHAFKVMERAFAVLVARRAAAAARDRRPHVVRRSRRARRLRGRDAGGVRRPLHRRCRPGAARARPRARALRLRRQLRRRSVTLLLRDGFVPPEFLDLARKDGRSEQEDAAPRRAQGRDGRARDGRRRGRRLRRGRRVGCRACRCSRHSVTRRPRRSPSRAIVLGLLFAARGPRGERGEALRRAGDAPSPGRRARCGAAQRADRRARGRARLRRSRRARSSATARSCSVATARSAGSAPAEPAAPAALAPEPRSAARRRAEPPTSATASSRPPSRSRSPSRRDAPSGAVAARAASSALHPARARIEARRQAAPRATTAVRRKRARRRRTPTGRAARGIDAGRAPAATMARA